MKYLNISLAIFAAEDGDDRVDRWAAALGNAAGTGQTRESGPETQTLSQPYLVGPQKSWSSS